MSEIKYGLISKVDSDTLERTIDLICDEFKDDATISFCEIGIYSGQSGAALSLYINSKKRSVNSTGIDNKKDGEEIKYHYDNLIIGNSNEVYNQLKDNSQHLIFIDGCHCFAHVISDFFCYADKVKVGGYMAFHDAGKHILPFKDFQHGDKENPDAYISVRKALQKIGLLQDNYGEITIKYVEQFLDNWELIFDEADETNEAGGVCCFRKLF